MTNSHTQPHHPPVTIVGAGIGGLALAAALIKLGIQVEVYEQASRFSRVGTGIGLAPNAMKVLVGLGLGPRLEASAYQCEYRWSRVWDTGEEMVRYPVKAVMEQRYGTPYLLMHRGDVHQALYDLIPPGLVHFGAKVVGADDQGDVVELRFANGGRVTAGVVVGADGVHSPMREAMFGTEDARFTNRVAYRSVFPTSLLPEPLRLDGSQHEWLDHTKWWGPDRHIVMYYVSRGDEVYFTTSVPHEAWVAESFSARGDLDELVAAFEGFHPIVKSVLAACPSVQKWAIFERDPLPTWQSGHAVLLGDACHPMTPYMQQGAATALEDAVVLARCLADVDQSDIKDAFSRYEALRKGRTSIVQAESSKNLWDSTSVGSETVSQEYVYEYDAWTTPLD